MVFTAERRAAARMFSIGDENAMYHAVAMKVYPASPDSRANRPMRQIRRKVRKGDTAACSSRDNGRTE